jgi:hypothetical protein
MSIDLHWGSETRTTPVTDLSLLALCDDAAIATLSSAVDQLAPELRPGFDRLLVTDPGLHVTLYEFLTRQGHALLPPALRWCRSRGSELVERVADLGPVTFEATAIRRSSRGSAIELRVSSPGQWLPSLDAVCRTVDEDIFRGRRGRPGSLHVTIARTPEAAVATETVAGCPLDLTIAFDRFGLALATELPYGGLSWLFMSRGRKTLNPDLAGRSSWTPSDAN